LAKVPWPRRRLARRRGGSAGSRCGIPFFPRVLVHLVGLGHGVVQRVAVQPQPRVLLEAVPQLQQVLAVAAQLAGHPGRGLARGDAVEDQQQLGGAAMRPLQDGPGPGVEHPAAVAALVLQDRLPVAAVDPQAVPLTAPGTGQAVGVQQLDELAVAGLLVYVVLQGEIHGLGLHATGCNLLPGKPVRSQPSRGRARIRPHEPISFYYGIRLRGTTKNLGRESRENPVGDCIGVHPAEEGVPQPRSIIWVSSLALSGAGDHDGVSKGR
jgi:hypothetical protein